jgi:hypothetical protein
MGAGSDPLPHFIGTDNHQLFRSMIPQNPALRTSFADSLPVFWENRELSTPHKRVIPPSA